MPLAFYSSFFKATVHLKCWSVGLPMGRFFVWRCINWDVFGGHKWSSANVRFRVSLCLSLSFSLFLSLSLFLCRSLCLLLSLSLSDPVARFPCPANMLLQLLDLFIQLRLSGLSTERERDRQIDRETRTHRKRERETVWMSEWAVFPSVVWVSSVGIMCCASCDILGFRPSWRNW